jgi:hypothetical protein
MDWQTQLITLYLTVCKHYRDELWVYAQRFAPYTDLSFSDEEVIVIYLFGIIEKRREVKTIYAHAARYWHDWFPTLPSYVAYVQRLNQLADVFAVLLEKFCPTDTAVVPTGLADAMPIVLASQGRRFQAKVAPELASHGYCPTKHLYYYGVKLQAIGDARPGTLPLPRYLGITPAGMNDGHALQQVAPALPYDDLYADKAYEYLARDTTFPIGVLTPIKKDKGQERLDAADKLFSRAVSRVRQPIESLFNWIQEKTGIEAASKVRSSRGLLVHVFGRLAAAMYMLNGLSQHPHARQLAISCS